MKENDLVRFSILGDPVMHFAEVEFPHVTLCGACVEHGRAWRTPRSVDCMTCLVRASRPSITDRIATALHVPKEFLYGDDEDGGADDR